jgi:predicted PurR-regulated permease PerM
MEFEPRTVMTWSVTLAVIIGFLVVGRNLLIPLAIAILVWSLLNSLSSFFLRIPMVGRYIPGWLATTLAILSLLLLNVVVYQILVGQADALSKAAPVYQQNFSRLAESVSERLGIEAMPATDQLLANLDLGSVLSWVGGSVGALLADFLLIVIYVAFLLAEQRQMPTKISRLQPDETEQMELKTALMEVSRQVQRYVWMKSLISALTGFVSYLVLLWVGVDFAAVWGLLVFFLNFIPNIGSMLAVSFPALLTLIQFDSLQPFVLVILGLGATQFVIGNVIDPAVMGRSLNLSSFMILFSLALWGSIWGIPGMFLSVPLMVVTAIVCSHFRQLRWVAVMLSADGRLMTSPPQES